MHTNQPQNHPRSSARVVGGLAELIIPREFPTTDLMPEDGEQMVLTCALMSWGCNWGKKRGKMGQHRKWAALLCSIPGPWEFNDVMCWIADKAIPACLQAPL